MIVLVHNGHRVNEVYFKSKNIHFDSNKSIAYVLTNLSKTNPNELIIWVNIKFKDVINHKEINNIFHHKCVFSSYSINGGYCISDRIGYVEKTPFTNIKRDVNYPTWLMSSDVGGVYAETFNSIVSTVNINNNFDFFLTALAKHNMPQGLFCYSNPNLIENNSFIEATNKTESNYLLFKFVKQHYKTVWVFNLFMCFVIFEKRFPVFYFLKSMFVKRKKEKVVLNPLAFKSSLKVIKNKTVDVIIPTIGRMNSLYDVLKDLSKQSFLPKHVIIVEQNPILGSKTELNFLATETWPFQIKHKFIHQTGACNARNIALSLVESEWVLLGDDDNRFETSLIENLFNSIELLGVKVATTMYVQPNEVSKYLITNQTDIFGSGNTMIKSNLLKKVSFDMAFEFGYGEDSDFGMQLRKIGNDVVYFPEIKIKHLKLPFGGFRTSFVHGWEQDTIQPKPSPTIMLLIKKHCNTFQENGYKYVLFLKFYKEHKTKNPLKYIKIMENKWKRSEYWASELFINKKSQKH